MNLLKKIEEGVVLSVYKPLEWTSFDVVKKIKGLTRKSIPKLKIGHAGTLDPLAEGLLIICTQKMTKQVEVIQSKPKTYIANITLGANRPSYDKETEISETFSTEHLTKELVEEVLHSFLGVQEQFPPAFSAIKQGGKPIYLKARKGIDVEIRPKQVEIYSIRLLQYHLPHIEIEVCVSKGTYIRSLAYDIGKKLACGAYLNHLIRTKIGEYSIEDSLQVSQIHELIIDIEKTSENEELKN